jgi:hypothetical protein
VERALGDARSSAGNTRRRLTDSDEELRRAGIEPNDPVLYHNPVQDP